MDKKARMAFVGVGIMGQDLLKETLKNPKVEVAALCDLDPETLSKAAALCPADPRRYEDYKGLLADGGFDGVVVAVPQYLHSPVSIAALDAGFNTFCEKPMALNVRQCDAMIAAAKRSRKALMIGQVLQYIGVYRHILERVRAGEFGRPVAMRTIRTMGRWDPFWLRPWRLEEKTSGGLLLEVNVHEIDFMLRILGPAVEVSAAGRHFFNEECDYEDFLTAHITFANGAIGSITSAQCDFLGKSSAEIYLDKGSIYYDSVTQRAQFVQEGGKKEDIPFGEIHPEWENGVYREMREFAEVCLGESPVTIPGEEGMRAVEICQACYRSLREHRAVKLPLPR